MEKQELTSTPKELTSNHDFVGHALHAFGFQQVSSEPGDHQWFLGNCIVLYSSFDQVLVILSLKGKEALVIQRIPPTEAELCDIFEMYLAKIAERE